MCICVYFFFGSVWPVNKLAKLINVSIMNQHTLNNFSFIVLFSNVMSKNRIIFLLLTIWEGTELLSMSSFCNQWNIDLIPEDKENQLFCNKNVRSCILIEIRRVIFWVNRLLKLIWLQLKLINLTKQIRLWKTKIQRDSVIE